VRTRFAAGVLGGVVLVGALGGCGAGSTVTGSPQGRAPATSTSPRPQIADPLDLGHLTANTCAGLTAAQVAPYLGALGHTKADTADNGPLCDYLAADVSKPLLAIGVINVPTPTQDLLYGSAANLPWRKRIDPIAGYPAIDASADAGAQGDCATSIAVNDTQSLNVHFAETDPTGQYYANPCRASETLAAQLIKNIQSGVA
jgi:hypothetical protein